MKTPTIESVPAHFPALSKRAARRVIQRAFVLAGRDRAVRQPLRELELTTLWIVQDWGLEWTVRLERGRLDFHRGHVGRPQVTFRWQTADDFITHINTGVAQEESFQWIGDAAWRRMLDPVFTAFSKSLKAVLAHPVDDDGERLL